MKMMEEERLVAQLEALNQRLDKLLAKGRFLIWQGSWWRFLFLNFAAGLLHALGSALGTVVIAGGVFYLLSRLDVVQMVARFVEQTLNQVRWEQLMLPPGRWER